MEPSIVKQATRPEPNLELVQNQSEKKGGIFCSILSLQYTSLPLLSESLHRFSEWMNEWVWFIPFKFKFSASSSASSLWSSFPSLPFESPGYWVNNITPKHSARIVFLHSGFWYVKRKVLLLLFVFVRSFVVVIVEFELNNPNKKNSWILAVCINIWMWIHISSLSFSSCPDAAQQLNVL